MKDALKGDSTGSSESPFRVSLFEDVEITECGLVFEEIAWTDGFKLVAGVDEVGRGCLAGPVVAAACILDPTVPLPDGLNDSKQVAPDQREEIAAALKASCVAYSIGSVDAVDIDRINILEATKVAMRQAISGLSPAADYVLIDALQLKGLLTPYRSIIKGDSISASIAAASILAKTYRDELMRTLDAEYPNYGFAGHVGYGTKEHREAIRTFGPCPLHRRSFKGVVLEETSCLNS